MRLFLPSILTAGVLATNPAPAESSSKLRRAGTPANDPALASSSRPALINR